ncbi:MAG: DNA polymerase III subunit chi [Asticcacaulis sp.]
MPDFWFYHLEKTPMMQVLPDLLEKVVQKGWRAYVHGLEDDKIDALNSQLWTYSPASFLAHGVEGDDLAERQPILLGTSGAMVNQAEVYVSVSPTDLPDINGLQRCLIVFEGADEDHLSWARAQWKMLKSDGHELAYWKQNSQGRWEKMQ